MPEKQLQPKIFIATPMFGGMCTGFYLKSILLLQPVLQQVGMTCTMSFLFNESLITRARNIMAHQFLKTNCTHLMFIDADIRFNPHEFVPMVTADLDLICGIYPKKEINWRAVKAAFDDGASIEEAKKYSGSFVVNLADDVRDVAVSADQPIEILHGGTGFMLIKRRVFDEMKDHVPTYRSDVTDLCGDNKPGELIREYFATSIEPSTNRLLSEDYHFCSKWRAVGGKVYAAPWVRLAHVGTYIFEGEILTG